MLWDLGAGSFFKNVPDPNLVDFAFAVSAQCQPEWFGQLRERGFPTPQEGEKLAGHQKIAYHPPRRDYSTNHTGK